MLCREWRQISLALLLVNCHDVTGGIFSGEFYAKQYEKSFKLHNRPGEIKRTFRKSKGIASAGFEEGWHVQGETPELGLLSRL